MLSMKISDVVSAIVRQELRGKGREDEALHFHFDLSLSYYTEDGGDFSERRGLHLLYYVRPRLSYISVFSRALKNPFASVKEVSSWKHECTHDSCWSDIQVFSQIYFGMADKINAKLESAGLNQIAPYKMNAHNNFALFGMAYDWVKVACVEKNIEVL